MSKRPVRPRSPIADEPASPNPFEALRGRFGGGETLPPSPEMPADAGQQLAESGSRVVVRRENKGRGGKTVTRVSGLGLPPPALGALAREIKRALGCGAMLDGDDVVLQGSLVERAASWLRPRGHGDVTIGN